VAAEMFIKFNERTLARKAEEEQNRKRVNINISAVQGNEDNVDLPDGCVEVEEGEEVRLAVLWQRPSQSEEEKEEKEEMEEEMPPSSAPSNATMVMSVPAVAAADDLQSFIERYVKEAGVHANWRWRGDRENALLAAAVRENIKLQMDVLKKAVMAHVRGEPLSVVRERDEKMNERESDTA
jgi:hypothetical protein